MLSCNLRTFPPLYFQLACKNDSPYLLKLSDSFKCKIYSISGKTEIPHVVEPASLTNESVIKVSFTAKVSGTYRMNFSLNNVAIGDAEIFRKYSPGMHVGRSYHISCVKKYECTGDCKIFTPRGRTPKVLYLAYQVTFNNFVGCTYNSLSIEHGLSFLPS